MSDNTQSLRLEWRSPSELQENPLNWRTHPAEQMAALSDIISEVGWLGCILWNERTGHILNGHARKKLATEQGLDKVPVLICDISEEQERKVLATFDPITGMATVDAGQLEMLLKQVDTDSDPIKAILDDLEKSLEVPTELRPVSIQELPTMAWALVGIPVQRFGELAGMLEQIALIPGVFCEITQNRQSQSEGQT